MDPYPEEFCSWGFLFPLRIFLNLYKFHHTFQKLTILWHSEDFCRKDDHWWKKLSFIFWMIRNKEICSISISNILYNIYNIRIWNHPTPKFAYLDICRNRFYSLDRYQNSEWALHTRANWRSPIFGIKTASAKKLRFNGFQESYFRTKLVMLVINCLRWLGKQSSLKSADIYLSQLSTLIWVCVLI